MTKVCTMYDWFIQYDDNWHNHGGDVTAAEESDILEKMKRGVRGGTLSTKDAKGKVHRGRWWMDSSYGVEPP